MSEESRPALRQAFDAIEAGDLEAARAILQPILAAEPDNPDAWWIYSHAVTDPQEALNALEQVARIDPQYPGAADLLVTLRERLPRRPTTITSPPPPPANFPDMPADEPDFGTDDFDKTPARGMAPVDEEDEEPSRRSLLPILAAVLLILVIVALIFSLVSQTGQPATPTAVVDAPTNIIPTAAVPTTSAVTEEPPTAILPPTVLPLLTAEPVILETITPTQAMSGQPEFTSEAQSAPTEELIGRPELTPSAEATEGAVSASMTEAETALLGGLRRFTLAEQSLTRETTALGETVLVNVCVADRREVAPALRPVMRGIANGTAALGAEVAAVGARMMDCATGRAFVVMAIDRASAEAHAAGALPYVEFRQLWQPQR